MSYSPKSMVTRLPLKLIRGLKTDHKYMCRWYNHMNKTKCSSLTLENGSNLMKSTLNNEGTASKQDEECIKK